MNDLTKKIGESQQLIESIIKKTADVGNISDLISVVIGDDSEKGYSTVQVTEILEKLELTKEQIIDGGPNKIITNTEMGKTSLSPISCQDIYVAVYLEKKGAPNDYKSYMEFMKNLSISSNLYKICISDLSRYLSKKEEFPMFFTKLEYGFSDAVDGKISEKDFSSIFMIIKNISPSIKDAFFQFMNNSTNDFIKNVRLYILEKIS